MSLLFEATRRLLSVPAVVLRGETTKDAEPHVLRHENAVLRRQLAGRVRYEPADRFWFAFLTGNATIATTAAPSTPTPKGSQHDRRRTAEALRQDHRHPAEADGRRPEVPCRVLLFKRREVELVGMFRCAWFG
ncbi:hypothetical protein AB0K14_40420 [Actinosynnema sp. NPDC050801]|uniref:hypothetical protein n=1 Tax=unclassified Actinosynnema TaxID=2637065 RepID=UPI0033DC01C7